MVAAVVLAVGAGSALAVAPATQDCKANGRLIHHYTNAELRNALATMSQTDIEYTNCYQVIQDQLNAQLPSHVSSAGTAKSTSRSFFSAPVVIVLIVIVLAGGGFALAARKRGAGGRSGDGEPPPAGGS
ncbi:MAG: hypothetical protein ACLP8S_22000 [Solirubrobacteraceae bacterium]